MHFSSLFKYIAVPAGTAQCPIPCRLRGAQRVEQVRATSPRRGRTAHRSRPRGSPERLSQDGEAGRLRRRRRPGPGCSGGPGAGIGASGGSSPGAGGGSAAAAFTASRAVLCPRGPGRAGRGGSRVGLSLSVRGNLGGRSHAEDGGAGLRPHGPEETVGQGAPAAAVALRADLVDGGGAVFHFVGQLVELMGQLLHCARPEAAPHAEGGEVGVAVNALAVAPDADVSILPAAAREEKRDGE